MSNEVNLDLLVDLVIEQTKRIEESIKESRVTNILLLGAAMHLDATEPIQNAKIGRYLKNVESAVVGDVND